jgi:drug/metabolite transporter (DMT)-like permease
MTIRPNPRSLASSWITVAFLYVYVAWGATYLGVHCGLESIPPFLLAGSRFLVAGLLLLGLIRIFQADSFHLGNGKEWSEAALVAVLIPVGGNGLVAWAQVSVPSGLAALLFGSMPLWIIFFDWIRPKGVVPSIQTCVGLGLGLLGVFVLVKPDLGHGWSSLLLLREITLLFAACSWAAGGIYSRHVHARGSALLPMARQMIVGGVVLLLLSLLTGDWRDFSLERVTLVSWLGLIYLIFFGSLLGFTIYVWLLRVSSPARVATISYVNLVVAVLIGCWVLREPITPRLAVGGAIILTSVALVLKKSENEISVPAD